MFYVENIYPDELYNFHKEHYNETSGVLLQYLVKLYV